MTRDGEENHSIQKGMYSNQDTQRMESSFKKIVHFDLKGSPPKLDYLLYVMKLSKTYGADGFLIEYEDMFPWDGELKVLRSKNAYSVDDIKTIIDVAKKLSMFVIPLVQTFGHMEFVLKHEEFSMLRRNPSDERSICPVQIGSIKLIQKILDQVVDLHPNSEWIHIGGDEVYGLGTCQSCPEKSMSSSDLYIHHMSRVLNHVATHKRRNGKKIKSIIWDDMIRSWPIEKLKKFQHLTTIMVWKYDSNIEEGFPTGMWERYKEVFSRIWTASAFKGAETQNSNFVLANPRINNHMNWLRKMSNLRKEGLDMEGIALTGWSRYDHRLPLCETLPAGIPMMALLLASTDIGDINQVLLNVSTDLGFKNNFVDIKNVADIFISQDSVFKGSDVYSFVAEFEKTLELLQDAENNLDSDSRKKKYLICKNNLEMLKQQLPKLFQKYFFDDMINEWIATKIDVHITHLEKLIG